MYSSPTYEPADSLGQIAGLTDNFGTTPDGGFTFGNETDENPQATPVLSSTSSRVPTSGTSTTSGNQLVINRSDLDTVEGQQFALTMIAQRENRPDFDPGGVDGKKGPATIRAIKAFQLSRGLSPDGIVGNLTKAALTQAIGGQPINVTPQQLQTIVSNAQGATGAAPPIPVPGQSSQGGAAVPVKGAPTTSTLPAPSLPITKTSNVTPAAGGGIDRRLLIGGGIVLAAVAAGVAAYEIKKHVKKQRRAA